MSTMFGRALVLVALGLACAPAESSTSATPPDGSGGRQAPAGSGGGTGTGGARPGGIGTGGAATGGAGTGGAGTGGAGAAGASGTAGASGAAGASGNDPLYAAATCTSKKTWSTGETQNMAPGQSCPDCHANFQLAGTLYPSGHEPDDCNGVDGLANNVYVLVTDATGRQVTLYPNSVGNFYTSIAVTPPFTAKVVANGKERAMLVEQTIGSCNTCHTQTGLNGAPGRITLPVI